MSGAVRLIVASNSGTAADALRRVVAVAALAAMWLLLASCNRSNKHAPVPPTSPPVAPLAEPTAATGPPQSASQVGLAALPVEQRFATRHFDALGTTVQVRLPAAATMADQLRIVREVFEVVGRRLTTASEAAPIARLNAAAGRAAVPVDDDVRWLLGKAQQVRDQSGGAWDVTGAALVALWRFDAPNPKPPSAAAIADAVTLVDSAKLQIDTGAGTVALAKRGMRVSLLRIARGYAMQLAGEKLRMLGVHSFAIGAGAQILVSGGKRGKPWQVPVNDPAGTRGGVHTVQLAVVSGAVASRGVDDVAFVSAGISYHDVLDPRTGNPSKAALRATVLMEEPTMASAVAHALVVLGPAKGLRMLRSMPGVEAVVVDNDGRLHTTAGIADRLLVTPVATP